MKTFKIFGGFWGQNMYICSYIYVCFVLPFFLSHLLKNFLIFKKTWLLAVETLIQGASLIFNFDNSFHCLPGL